MEGFGRGWRLEEYFEGRVERLIIIYIEEEYDVERGIEVEVGGYLGFGELEEKRLLG